MYVCICHAVTDAAIQKAVAGGATAEEIARRTGAGTACGECAQAVAALVATPKRCERTGGACTGCSGTPHPA